MRRLPVITRSALVALLTASTGACGDAAAPDGPAPTAVVPGSWAVAYDLTAVPPLVLDVGRADPQATLVVAPIDHLGIPWDAFDGPTDLPVDPPAPWVDALDAAVAALRADGRPFALVVSPLAPDFDTFASDAREANGRLIVDPSHFPPCFDPARETRPEDLRDRFARYVAWITVRARPAHLVVGHRLNLLEARCGDGPWQSALGFVSAAIARVRAAAEAEPVPGTEPFVAPPITVGLDVEDLHGLPRQPGRCAGVSPAACLATRAPALSAAIAAQLSGASAPDILGLESYPAAVLSAEPTADIPGDYLSGAIAAVSGLAPKVGLLGTALPAVPLVSRQGPCVTVMPSDDARQIRWLDLALSAASARAMPYVAWRTHTDLGPTAAVASCPCAGDTSFCDHLDDLGSRADATRLRILEGLVASDGTPRPALTRWRMAAP